MFEGDDFPKVKIKIFFYSARKDILVGGFSQVQYVIYDSNAWLLAMIVKDLFLKGEKPVDFTYYDPYEYAIQEGFTYRFKIVIDPQMGECMFVEAYCTHSQQDDFNVFLSKRRYDSCDVNVVKALDTHPRGYKPVY